MKKKGHPSIVILADFFPQNVLFDGTDGTVIKSVLQNSSYFVGIYNMYISTYIRNKNCHQHSYGFQNLMSSWGWGSKFSNLQQVGNFSIFGSNSFSARVGA